MPKFVNSNGIWKTMGSEYVNNNGVWKKQTSGYVNNNGIWKLYTRVPGILKMQPSASISWEDGYIYDYQYFSYDNASHFSVHAAYYSRCHPSVSWKSSNTLDLKAGDEIKINGYCWGSSNGWQDWSGSIWLLRKGDTTAKDMKFHYVSAYPSSSYDGIKDGVETRYCQLDGEYELELSAGINSYGSCSGTVSIYSLTVNGINCLNMVL